MHVVFLILISVASIGLAELLTRRLSLPTRVTRRVVHVVTAVVAAASPLVASGTEIATVSLLFAGALFVSRSRRLLTSIHTAERNTLGEVWLPLGVAITALLFLPTSMAAFQFGVLVMGIADPIAGLVGERMQRREKTILGFRKTAAGSAAFFLTTLLITVAFMPSFGPLLLCIPLALTFTEMTLEYGLDNLALPIVAAALFQALV